MSALASGLVLLSAVLPTQAPTAPTPDQVRQTIRRSVPFLEKEGAAWIKGRKCMSCHQVPSMIWGLNQARRHGVAVDAAQLETATQWVAQQVPSGGGGPGNQFIAAFLAFGSPTEKDRDKFLNGLVKAQGKDGLWTGASQFQAQKRPAAETNQVTTQWAVWAMNYAQPLPEAAVQARERALAALKDTQPGVSTESLVLHMLLAGNTARAAELRSQLLRQQHADGGWGWLRENPTSDALTTGMVLYALAAGRDEAVNGPIGKAWDYLLKSQRPDGSWYLSRSVIGPTKKNPADGDYIYSYWATGWAVIGLAETLPTN